MDLGEIIKKQRKDMGLTRQQLADRIRVSVASIYIWENGDYIPTRVNLKKLTDIGFAINEGDIKRPGDFVFQDRTHNHLHQTRWVQRFDRYTQKYMEGKSNTYDGDDWLITRGQPVKPSRIKQFILDLIYKKNEKIIMLAENTKYTDVNNKFREGYNAALSDIKEAIEKDELLI